MNKWIILYSTLAQGMHDISFLLTAILRITARFTEAFLFLTLLFSSCSAQSKKLSKQFSIPQCDRTASEKVTT